ncbi:Carboxylic ester hydrolase [Madurella fahalii]|uniref:Carboxylic ester hydrolase n=1 Tax=Madurella fahalii TaxID=1157608 RepID=A0ABQ0G0Q2_9PEZI
MVVVIALSWHGLRGINILGGAVCSQESASMAGPHDAEDACESCPLIESSDRISSRRKTDHVYQTAGPAVIRPASSPPTAVAVLLTLLVLELQLGILVFILVLHGDVEEVRLIAACRPQPSLIGTCRVDLNYTTYEGVQLPNGVNAFLGMRYAAPPLGNLRWRAPVEPAWTGTVEQATEFPPICLGIGTSYPSAGQDEDCLFVNVWAPSNATAQSKLPVWLFIQGGGYVANTNANWNGAEVVEKSGHNVVLVNFNYRVGLWGFLASERVRGDGDLNAGLLDQRMLMTWVKAHIVSFGGDPDYVVIHGASAGAGSVAMHLIAYGGRNDNLFVAGVAESIFFPAQPFVRELEYQFDRVASQIGCDGIAPVQQMACLRSKDAALLQTANRAQAFPGRSEPPMPLFYWTPCVDGDLLRDLPYNLFKRRQYINVPLLFGTSTNEGSVFAANAATESDVAIFLTNNYPHLTPNDTDAILAQYPRLPALPRHNAWFPTASQAYGEATFICPQTNILNLLQYAQHAQHAQHAQPPPPLYAYRYNVRDAENAAAGLGVPHLFDAAAIFGPDSIRDAHVSYRTYNAPVVPLVMGYYTSFVRALDPNRHRAPGSLEWLPWAGGGGGGEGGGEGDMRRMVFETGGDARMEDVPGDERERCRFWEEGLGDRLEQLWRV